MRRVHRVARQRERRAPKRNRRRPRASWRQAAAGRLGRAPATDRGGRRGLAGRGRRRARSRSISTASGRMVDRPRRRRLPRADLLSWRRLLLGFDRQPPPIGDRGRTGRGPAHARRPPIASRPSIRFRPRATTRSTVWRRLRRDGYAANRIAVGGDSAGANLTLALVGELKRAGEDLPGCLWLLSPWVDLTMSGATLVSKSAVDPLIQKGYLEELADAYLAGGMDRKDPRLSPLYADLKGLPPTLIQIGSAETLLDDAVRFAAAAGEADVARDPRNLAAHDPRLAALERASRTWPPRARACGRVLQGTPVGAALPERSRLPKPRNAGTQISGPNRVREPGG